MPKTIGKYELHRTLGEGSFGKYDSFVFKLARRPCIYFFICFRVKYAVNKETNEAVAIKVLDKVSFFISCAKFIFQIIDFQLAWLVGDASKEGYERPN